LASGRYKRYLTNDKKGRIRLDREAVRQVARLDGKWVLQTNDDTLTLDDAAAGYKGLLVIERCFRALKRARIKMEPMYHWLPCRIQAHVKICVFALLIERVAELQCKQPWSKLRRTLATLQTSEFQTKNNQFFQCNEASPELPGLFKSIEIPRPKIVLNLQSTTSKA
jgi:transposase